MRNRFDQLAKQLGQAALGRSGTTVTHAEITPETQYADLRHEPDPARSAERDGLGLLGRLAAHACLIEVYSQPPGPAEFRACLAKHLALWQHRDRARARARKACAQDAQPRVQDPPFLWIIAAGAPTKLLTQLDPSPATDWPAGVYFFGADVLRVGVVERRLCLRSPAPSRSRRTSTLPPPRRA